MKNKEHRWHTDSDLWEKLKSIARESRHNPTKAEKLLWKYLRDGRLNGLKFRRQHSIGPFIVDFYCAKAKLVIEIGGEIHQYQKEQDSIRQQYLEESGLKVVRFFNSEIIGDIDKVKKLLLEVLAT